LLGLLWKIREPKGETQYVAVVVRLPHPPLRKKTPAYRGDRHDRCQALKIKLFDGDLFLFFLCPTTVMTVTRPFALQNPTRNLNCHNGHPATVTGRPSKQTRHNGHLTSSRIAGIAKEPLIGNSPMSHKHEQTDTPQRSPDQLQSRWIAKEPLIGNSPMSHKHASNVQTLHVTTVT